MALNFFKQRDIDEMDINDIPEEFINYLDTLDEAGKKGLLASRPDIAEVLGVSIEDSNQDTVNTTDDSSKIVQQNERNLESSVVFEEEQNILNSGDVEPDADENKEADEDNNDIIIDATSDQKPASTEDDEADQDDAKTADK